MSDLKAERTKRKLTLASVAAAVDTDPGNLSKIERGLQVPSKELARRLFEFYGGDVDLGRVYDADYTERRRNSSRPAVAG